MTRRPPLCRACTAEIGRPVRHAKRRLCSQVQGERRRDATDARRAEQLKRWRASQRTVKAKTRTRRKEAR